ncbi:unnamed protein product, partial [Owenia fusiformis]
NMHRILRKIRIATFPSTVLIATAVFQSESPKVSAKAITMEQAEAKPSKEIEPNNALVAKQPPSEVVMVTGGCGFLGQHIVKLLHERGDGVKEIRVFDKKPYIKELDYAEEKPMVTIVGDVTDARQVEEALKGVDAVIHTAGLISYGTFPDEEGMEQINVKGTENIINGCIKKKVERLIYTSTVDVVIGYEDIINGEESTTAIPRRFLFPGYPASKYKAECNVLSAHMNKLHDSDKRLLSLSLRPNVMYGEMDPYYVTTSIKGAKENGGTLPRVGNGRAKFQQAYVGNVAWAHICANEALKSAPSIGGKPYFITDDTPIQNTFTFMEPFLKLHGYSVSRYYLPYWVVYAGFYTLESILWAIQPVKKIHLDSCLCSIIYINHDIYFNGGQARNKLGYKPVFNPQEAIEKSAKYYAEIKV